MTLYPTDRFRGLETPFYYYDLDLLKATLTSCKSEAERHGFHVHYAMKANFNPRILQAICTAGFGADCVSGNEIKCAIETGFKPENIFFAGVGKTDEEINLGLIYNIACLNVESIEELRVINKLAGVRKQKARIALRVNPNIDAKTHKNITTGLEENKFGINEWELPDCVEVLKECANLQLVGIHFHVGSQITDMDVFKELCNSVNETAQFFEDNGHAVKILNVGGGLGVDYENTDGNPIADFKAYFGVFKDNLKIKKSQQVHFELGRALVAHCGTLVARVLYTKQGVKKNFAILDAGMTELMRPALYGAVHKIENLSSKSGSMKYDVVGPICESTDVFAQGVELPETKRGDMVVIHTTGAYGEVMASNYNLRGSVKTVFSGE
jgi:diaminopimelate decarboxylase